MMRIQQQANIYLSFQETAYPFQHPGAACKLIAIEFQIHVAVPTVIIDSAIPPCKVTVCGHVGAVRRSFEFFCRLKLGAQEIQHKGLALGHICGI